MPDYPRHFWNNNGVDIAAFFIPQAVLPGIVGRMFIRPYTWNWGGRGEWAGHLGYDVDGKGTD